MPMSGLDGLDSLIYVFGLALPRYSTHCTHVLIGFVTSATLLSLSYLEAFSDTCMIR